MHTRACARKRTHVPGAHDRETPPLCPVDRSSPVSREREDRRASLASFSLCSSSCPPRAPRQGGRGWQVDGTTGAIDPTPDLYVENVREELDEADEWFYDDATRELFVCYNGTGAPPADLQFVATNLPRLIEVVGTSAAPVRDVRVAGIGLRDTSYTCVPPLPTPRPLLRPP